MDDSRELNPAIRPDVVEAIAARIDWKQAPIWCGAYIVVCVNHGETFVDESGTEHPRVEVGGVWVMHDSGRRIAAPSFGITELVPGQVCIVRRPGALYDGIACLLLRTYFQHHNWLNLCPHELLPQTDEDYVRPDFPPAAIMPTAIAIACARDRMNWLDRAA